MVDLHGQYVRLKEEIDKAMLSVIDSSAFINGSEVKEFCSHLADYLQVPYVIPCGNGTDALQIALMALGLQPGDEVIIPGFTYVAAAEVVALLRMTPVLVDVDLNSFNLDPSKLEEAIRQSNAKAIIAVHLFGQSCDMAPILQLAEKYNLYVVEDNAQSVGAVYTFPDGHSQMTGTMGDIGTTSFFPSKPLACYGDGGAIFTHNPKWAERLKMIANHGQKCKYHHQVIGCNSRLDTLQAAVLDVKLKYLESFNKARQRVAAGYDKAFAPIDGIVTPKRSPFSTHVYHQYTLQLHPDKRDDVRTYLKENGVPSMIYYPLPIDDQVAYRQITRLPDLLDNSALLSRSVLSLPIHTEMTDEEQDYIIQTVLSAIETVG